MTKMNCNAKIIVEGRGWGKRERHLTEISVRSSRFEIVPLGFSREARAGSNAVLGSRGTPQVTVHVLLEASLSRPLVV